MVEATMAAKLRGELKEALKVDEGANRTASNLTAVRARPEPVDQTSKYENYRITPSPRHRLACRLSLSLAVAACLRLPSTCRLPTATLFPTMTT